MTPYQFYFYSSGVIEERWGGAEFVLNRVSATIGTAFGGIIAFAIMVVAAVALYPQQGEAITLGLLGDVIGGHFGGVGWLLFLTGTFAVSMGAGLETALATAYSVTQYFGFDWGKHFRPREAPVFSLVYTAMVPLAVLIALTGVDPIQLTLWAMAVAAFSLPFSLGPILVVANDRVYMGEQENSRAINTIALVILSLLTLVTVTTIPLLLWNLVA
jgi:Mn2+/Fe2+ NRAMP family transporter